MRVTAGIILLALGATGAAGSLLFLSSLLRSAVPFNPFTALAVLTLLIGAGIAGGGISAIRRKFLWWSLAGAICLVIVAIVFTVLIIQAPTIPGDEPTLTDRLRSSSPLWGICGIPGVLALIFLVKRRGEFQT